MKVQNHAVDAYARTALTPVQSPRAAAPTGAVASDEAAHVTVSAEARALAARAASSNSDFDPQKVAALKSKIDKGEFFVSPQQLALRLIDHLG